jgi:hypothetical protein
LGQLAETLEKIIPGTLPSTTNAEKETEKTHTDVIARYQLIFARTEGDIIKLPELSERFKEIMTTKSKERRQAELEEALGTYKSELKAGSDHYLAHSITFDPSQVDGPFTEALLGCRFLTKNLHDQPNMAKDKLTPLTFLTPKERSPDYQQRVENLRLVRRQLDQGEDATRVGKKAVDIYHDGLQSKIYHVQSMVANFWYTMSFICEDFQNSLLWKSFRNFDTILRCDDGQKWAARFGKTEHLAHTLLLELGRIMHQHAEVSTRSVYRKAIKNGEDISSDALEMAKIVANGILLDLQKVVPIGILGRYAEAPSTWNHFTKTKKSEIPTSSDRKREGRFEPKAGPPPKKPADRDSHGKEKGMLEYSGRGAPPPLDIIDVHPITKAKAALCPHFVTKGYECGFGKDCKKIHLARKENLNIDNQKKLSQIVNANKELTFTKPPGTQK